MRRSARSVGTYGRLTWSASTCSSIISMKVLIMLSTDLNVYSSGSCLLCHATMDATNRIIGNTIIIIADLSR
jgi:hypothetical protein